MEDCSSVEWLTACAALPAAPAENMAEDKKVANRKDRSGEPYMVSGTASCTVIDSMAAAKIALVLLA